MSRIDEALKRLAGVVSSPDPRPSSPSLDSYASENTARVEESHHGWPEDRKIASFSSTGPRAVESRPPAAKSQVTEPAPRVQRAEGMAQSEPKTDTEPLIEIKPLINYAGFVARAVGRHKLLAAVTVALVLAMTAGALALMPKTYYVETTLLAQRNAVMTALSNPGRSVPWDADAPTRAAAETVLRRDNLIALIDKTDLLREWERTRVPILRLKDWLKQAVTQYVLTTEDKLDALIGTLESRMRVDAGPVGDGTVKIEILWPDPDMAARLVQEAQQAFLDARQVAETAAIGESIGILERYSASLKEGINVRLAELQRTQATTALPAAARPRVTPRVPDAAFGPSLEAILQSPLPEDSLDSDPDIGRLKASIAAKRQELARLEETRQRQLSEVQARLAQLKTVYTANHPSVISAQQNLSALMQEGPQVSTLAAEIEETQAEYDQRLSDAAELAIQTALTRRPSGVRSRDQALTAAQTVEANPMAERAGSPGREYATLSLRSELRQLESVLERTDAARIELAVSQAAFKYRYTVIRPAQVPRDPVFPNFNLVLIAGALAGLILAVCAVVAKDFLSGRILEPWQVEHQLGLPVLGTLRMG